MILSHYTKRAGLEGILRSGALWATNFLDLGDPSEYFYAWTVLNREAMRLTMEKMPVDLRKPEFDLDKTATIATEQLRTFGKSSDPSGQLYVFSFATGLDDDENARGVLTLWKLYAKMEYCLQFNKDDIERVLSAETTWWNYEAVNLVQVRYKIEREHADFKELAFQLSQYYLRDIYKATNDNRICEGIQVDRWMAEPAFLRRMLEFCASHKDPLYKDEREVRIFAYPSARNETRVLTGIASKKNIVTSSEGKRYIALGAAVRPGFVPFQIIGANKADLDLSGLLKADEFHPKYSRILLPVTD